MKSRPESAGGARPYCVQHCPVKAIKLEENNIKIIPERCILCGNCIKACPHQAMDYKSGINRVKEYLAGDGKTIACLDASFPAAVVNSSPRQWVTALKNLGFTEVWEGAFGAELVSRAYTRILQHDTKGPVISSVCPAIVFYVQKYLPQLIPDLAPICVAHDCNWKGRAPGKTGVEDDLYHVLPHTDRGDGSPRGRGLYR